MVRRVREVAQRKGGGEWTVVVVQPTGSLCGTEGVARRLGVCPALPLEDSEAEC